MLIETAFRLFIMLLSLCINGMCTFKTLRSKTLISGYVIFSFDFVGRFLKLSKHVPLYFIAMLIGLRKSFVG